MVDAVRPTFVKEDPAAIAELNRINQNNSGQDLELAPRAIRPSAPRGVRARWKKGKLTITHKTKLRKGTKLIVSLNDSGKLTRTTTTRLVLNVPKRPIGKIAVAVILNNGRGTSTWVQVRLS